jgi:hypothetical protein
VTSRCQDVALLLDELVDGTLDETRERAVRGHLRECIDCARRAEETHRLVAAASQLESLDPPSEMWARLEARLDREEIEFSQKPRWWWWWHAWRRTLLASGLGLAAATTAVIFFLRTRPAPTSTPAVTASVPPEKLYQAAVDQVERAEVDYTTAIDDLRKIVGEERARWRPEVARAFDENLATIDAAIERQRGLAREQPGDPVASDALAESYRREIDFLQDAVTRGGAP